jgi:hypothetical protein
MQRPAGKRGIWAGIVAAALLGEDVAWAQGFPAQPAAPVVCTPCPSAVTTLAKGLRPTSLAADDTNVYFTDSYSMATGYRAVGKVPIGGGSPATLYASQAGITNSSLQLAGGYLYWADQRGVWSISTAGGAAIQLLHTGSGTYLLSSHTLVHAPSRGDAYLMFHSNQQSSNLFAMSTVLFFWTWTKLFSASDGIFYYPYSVTADATRIYFLSFGGRLFSKPRAGGAPTELATGADNSVLTTDGIGLYFVKDSSIMSISVEGGPISTFATGCSSVTDMVIDGKQLYWTCASNGTVMRQALGGGIGPTTLASGQSSPSCLTVHGDRVYFGTQNALKSVAK